MKIIYFFKQLKQKIGLADGVHSIIGVIIVVVPIIIFKCMLSADSEVKMSFLGAYLGGIITYFGVLLTVHNTNKLSEANEAKEKNRIFEEKRLNNLPYIGIEFIKMDKTEQQDAAIVYETLFYNKAGNSLLFKLLSIRNYGLGGAFNLNIRVYENLNDFHYLNFQKMLYFLTVVK